MSIASGPHFEVSPATLADWLETNGLTSWWVVDGDTYLTSRIAFPTSAKNLIALLRDIDRPMFVRDLSANEDSKGRAIEPELLGQQVEHLRDTVHQIGSTVTEPKWFNDRFFAFCWKDRPEEVAEWLLVEDTESAKAFEDVELPAL